MIATRQPQKTERVLHMFKKMNLFFFDEEEITLHDFIWFYGVYAFIIFLMLLVVLPALLVSVN